MLIGVAISAIVDCSEGHRHSRVLKGVAILLVVGMIGESLYKQRDYLFNLTPTAVARSVYGGNPFPESLPIAEYIKKHTNEGDRIAVIG